MSLDNGVARRSVLLGAAGAAGVAATGAIPAVAAAGDDAAAEKGGGPKAPSLWRRADRNGLLYGTTWATWQEGNDLTRLIDKHANVMFPEDDLLWYKLKPTIDSPLDFTGGDAFFARAEAAKMRIIAAHLVWDEGFGEGWNWGDDLWELTRKQAEKVLWPTVRKTVERYKGRADAWIVCNEVSDPEGKKGVRTNVPWYNTIGPEYIAKAFRIAHREDPKADLILNEFGFETVNEWGDRAVDRRKAFLQVIDMLQKKDVPLHVAGIQAHLLADQFADRFDKQGYQRFLRELRHRGLKIFITEMDVLDDGLPKNVEKRDKMIADVYRRYLDATLEEEAVKVVVNFGLTDRFTWLQEDYPRDDGGERRPLPFDSDLRRKPAYRAIRNKLRQAPRRKPIWKSLK